VNVLIWHVHGSWLDNFVRGQHTCLLPVVPERSDDGRGRARTWHWPDRVVEVTPDELADWPVDVVIVQGPRELELAHRWLGGRRPGRDIPLVWLEHNAPDGSVVDMRHPAADCGRCVLVHVTPTNALFWDSGATTTRVIEHGVAIPVPVWTGTVPAVGVVVNDPVRRGRVVGTDLLRRFGEHVALDVFGMNVDALERGGAHPWLRTFEDLPQSRMHAELAQRRCYLHPFRWTSLGLSLLEAMAMGMPVVALARTAVPDAVPTGAGVVSNDLAVLAGALERLMCDDDFAAELSLGARRRVAERFGLDRFLSDWNELLEEVA
jgi:hypothetical protein